MKTKIFYDFEATSVSRDADMISVGLVADLGTPKVKSFYAEFTDFSLDKCADWVKENVVGRLFLEHKLYSYEYLKSASILDSYVEMRENTKTVSMLLKQWLSQFEEIEFWADYDNKDRTYLQELIGDWTNYMIGGVPEHLPNIKYDHFFDLHTLFKIKGIDTDIDREEFSGLKGIADACSGKYIGKHYALYDAHITAVCYDKLMK